VSHEEFIEAQDVPHVDDARYVAKLESTERTKTRFGDARKWHFVLPAEDDFQVSTITSLATSSGSRGGQLIRALLGRGLQSGEKLPLEELVGKKCVLELGTDPDSGWNRIAAVEAHRPKQPAKQPEVDADDFPFDGAAA